MSQPPAPNKADAGMEKLFSRLPTLIDQARKGTMQPQATAQVSDGLYPLLRSIADNNNGSCQTCPYRSFDNYCAIDVLPSRRGSKPTTCQVPLRIYLLSSIQLYRHQLKVHPLHLDRAQVRVLQLKQDLAVLESSRYRRLRRPRILHLELLCRPIRITSDHLFLGLPLRSHVPPCRVKHYHRLARISSPLRHRLRDQSTSERLREHQHGRHLRLQVR